MKKKFLLLFTYNISLDDWFKNGSIDREKRYYESLSEYYDITFLTYGDQGDLKYQKFFKKIKIVPIFKNKKNSYFNFFKSILFVFNDNFFFSSFDIIKTNQMWGSWIGVLIKLLYKKKLVIRCGYELLKNSMNANSSILRKSLYYLICTFAYKNADLIIVTTNKIKQFVRKNIKCKSKIFVIPNYVDLSVFKNLKKQKTLKRNILTIGRLEEEKNHLMIIKALKDTNITLDFIGKGRLKEKLKTYCSQNNLRCNFVDKINNYKLPKIISRYPLYVQTSNYEGNPKTILEVMAVGVPIVGTDVDGINDLIKQNFNGFLVKRNNSKYLRKIIFDILSKKINVKRIKQKALSYIKKNHNLNHIVRKEVKVLKNF